MYFPKVSNNKMTHIVFSNAQYDHTHDHDNHTPSLTRKDCTKIKIHQWCAKHPWTSCPLNTHSIIVVWFYGAKAIKQGWHEMLYVSR